MGSLTSPLAKSERQDGSVFWGRAGWGGGCTRLVTPMPQAGRPLSRGPGLGPAQGSWDLVPLSSDRRRLARRLLALPPRLRAPPAPLFLVLSLLSASILPPASGLSPPVAGPSISVIPPWLPPAPGHTLSLPGSQPVWESVPPCQLSVSMVSQTLTSSCLLPPHASPSF